MTFELWLLLAAVLAIVVLTNHLADTLEEDDDETAVESYTPPATTATTKPAVPLACLQSLQVAATLQGDNSLKTPPFSATACQGVRMKTKNGGCYEAQNGIWVPTTECVDAKKAERDFREYVRRQEQTARTASRAAVRQAKDVARQARRATTPATTPAASLLTTAAAR